MPDLRIETMDSSGEFQNLVVTSGIVQKGILENASLLESELVAYSNYHTQSFTQKTIVINTKWAIVLIVLTHAGETPYDYISALYRLTGNIKALILKQWTVQLMLSWWRNLISCRVDYQCLVLTNIVALVGVIHTRGQFIRSHSTGEDFVSLIVAVFSISSWQQFELKFGVHDFRRKRLIGAGSTLTFVENDQGVGLPWHSSERTLLSRHSFLQWSVYSLTGQ